MPVNRFLAVVASLPAIVFAIQADGQDNIPLSFKEQQEVVRRVEAAKSYRQAAVIDADKRIYVVDLWAYEMRRAKPPRRMAEVLHFKYEGGETIRTTYDLNAHKVVKVEKLQAYPTPLAAQELTVAIEVARQNDHRVETLFGEDNESVLTELLVPIIADKNSPRFGHRIAKLMFRANPDAVETVSVEVDLTDSKLIVVPGSSSPEKK
ncbi:MAG: hypothetical protein ACKV0T_15380 [Planctomycetales bacterium]